MVGLDCKLYWNTASFGTPTWVEVTLARDLTVSDSTAEGDGSCRAYAFTSTELGLRTFEISGEMIYKPADTAFIAMKADYDARTISGIAMMDGSITTQGTKGKRADVVVTKFDRMEPMNDVIKYAFTLKVCTTDGRVPADYTVP